MKAAEIEKGRAGRLERGSAGEYQGAAMKKGWQTKRLGDFAAAVSTGPFGSILHKSDYVDDGVPLVNPINIVGESIVPDPSKLISGETIKRLSNYVLEEGDIVVGRRGEIGRCAVVGLNESGWVCGTGSFFIRPLPSLDSQFLAHLIRSPEYREQLEKLSTGATMKNLSNTALGDLVISVPPLAEQRRIVGLLDEAFEGLATAKANAEKNLQNARALFESHLQSVFTRRGPGWVEKKFEELIESNVIGLTKNSREQGDDKAWPYVKMNNITRDNRFDFSSFTCVDATAEELSKFSLKNGDFLFNTRNSHELVGKSCIYESDSNDAVLYNNNIMRVRFQRGIDARFVLLAFSSKGVANKLNALKSGTTNVSAIYFKDLKSLVIPVPPIVEQKNIAAKLYALSEETQRLARLYERNLAALEALKKSLLHQAFTGEL